MSIEPATTTQQELDLLAGYSSEFEQRDPARYDYLGLSAATLLRMKDVTMALFDKRYRAARDVIDIIARKIGINPEDTSYWLYAPDLDESSPLVDNLDYYLNHSGDKVLLKRRIKELEAENAVLRSLVVK